MLFHFSKDICLFNPNIYRSYSEIYRTIFVWATLWSLRRENTLPKMQKDICNWCSLKFQSLRYTNVLAFSKLEFHPQMRLHKIITLLSQCILLFICRGWSISLKKRYLYTFCVAFKNTWMQLKRSLRHFKDVIEQQPPLDDSSYRWLSVRCSVNWFLFLLCII